MSIIRAKKDRNNPYVQISKKVFDDPEISLKSKGFIGYCLSKPDHWIFHVEQLASVLKEKERCIYNVIKECIDHGYALRWQPRKPDGSFGQWETIISDSKEEIISIKEELISSGELKECLPHRCFADVDSADAQNSRLVINEGSKDRYKKEIIIAPSRLAIEKPKQPPDKKMPAGGNNNFYKCLEECSQLTPGQKKQFMKYPEEIVKKGIPFVTNYEPPLEGDNAFVKMLHRFCANPSAFEDTLNNQGKPPVKRDLKTRILARFKKGEVYNDNTEFMADERGLVFIYHMKNTSGYTQTHEYGLTWRDPDFSSKFDETLMKLNLSL